MILLLLFCLTIFLVTSVVMILSLILAKKNYVNREKSSPFECGFDSNCNHRLPFSLRFFLITIIFLIFDVEIVLLLPAVSTFSSSLITYWGSVLTFFLVILIYGVYHEWRQGALNWAT